MSPSGCIPSDLQVVEWEQRLQAQQRRHDASREHLNQMQKSLSTVQAGAEHLVRRLHHIKLVKAEISPSFAQFPFGENARS